MGAIFHMVQDDHPPLPQGVSEVTKNKKQKKTSPKNHRQLIYCCFVLWVFLSLSLS
jgi:hypothetical protein